MKPEVEGRGGGFGKYQGLTVTEVQALFDTCMQDPSMRSISAVLRITREQLEARGQLGIYPVFACVDLAICAAAAVLRQFGPASLTEIATKAALGTAGVFGLLLISTLPTWRARRTNLAQERAIRDRAVAALVTILESRPALKPLTIEQEFTVKILLRKAEGSEPLRTLL